MGMFDEITCGYPLPVSGLDGMVWQTKSLGCELAKYRITTAGALERMTYRYESRPPEEIERDRINSAERGWPVYVQTETAIENGWEAVELPRFFILEFHRSANGLWISVSVLFLNGRVDQIDVHTAALSSNPADVEPGFSTHDPTT